MATDTEKPTPESTGDPKATTRAEVRAKRDERRSERRAAKADKAAAKAAAKEEAAASGSSKEPKEKKEKTPRKRRSLPSIKGGVDSLRTLLGQVVWIVAVVCALFLAVGALCIALDANADNALVAFVLDGADVVSLGIFSLEGGLKEFRGVNSDVKNALVNYGLGAVAYLVVGRILDRVIRP